MKKEDLLLYPSEYLQKLWTGISREVKITFVSSMIIGLAIHLFFITNLLPNHDSVDLQQDFRWGIAIGRWFTFMPAFLSGNILVPWLRGLLAILYLSFSACLIVKCLRITNILNCVLISGLMLSFPPVVNSFTYILTVDLIFSSLLLSCLAVYVTLQFRYGFCIGFILITFSLGVYQAFFPFAAGLSVAVLIVDIIKDKYTLKHLLIKGGKLFQTLLFGMIVYFVITRFIQSWREIEFYSYQGIDQMGRISISGLPSLIRQSYTSIVRFFYGDVYGIHGSFLSCAFLTMFIIVLFLFLMIIIQKGITKKILNLIQLIVLIIIYPLSCNLIYIMAPNAFVYLNLIYGLVLLPIAVIALLELVQSYEMQNEKSFIFIVKRTFCWVISIIFGFCIYHYGILANKVYTKAHIVYEQAFAYSAELITRIQSVDGYTVNKPIIFFGTPGATINQVSIFDELYGFAGATNNIPGAHSYLEFLKNFMGFGSGVIFGNSTSVIQYKLEQGLSKMPIYPERDSIQVINDIVIVKFTSHVDNLAYISELPIPKNIDILEQNAFDINILEIINGSIVLRTGTIDPQLYIMFTPALNYFDGGGFIELTYTNTEPGFLQIYYDHGYGLHEEISTGLVAIQAELEETRIFLPIIPWGSINSLVGIRIDPPNDTVFILGGIRFIPEIR